MNYKGERMTEKEDKRYLFCTSGAFLVGFVLWIMYTRFEQFESQIIVGRSPVRYDAGYKAFLYPIGEGMFAGYVCMVFISGILFYYYFVKHKPIWFQLILLILFFVRPEASVVVYYWGSWYWTCLVFQYNLMKFWQTTKRWREYDDFY